MILWAMVVNSLILDTTINLPPLQWLIYHATCQSPMIHMFVNIKGGR